VSNWPWKTPAFARSLEEKKNKQNRHHTLLRPSHHYVLRRFEKLDKNGVEHLRTEAFDYHLHLWYMDTKMVGFFLTVHFVTV
jgi:hypothetical protein